MNRLIVFFGIGNYLKQNINWLRTILDVKYLCDNDESKWGRLFYGLKCISPKELKKQNCQVYITIENMEIALEIKQQLQNQGICVENFCLKRDDEKRGVKRKKLYLWGTLEECRKMHALFYNKQSEYEIEGYITCWAERIGKDFVSDIPIISVYKAENELLTGHIDGIVAVADELAFSFVTRDNVRQDVLESGRFYICKKGVLSQFIEKPEDFDIHQIMIPYENSYRLTMLQFMLTAKCNLNCKLCSHFAALVDENETYTYDEFVSDIERTAELFDSVDNLDLWGGEALLCKDLTKCLYKSRDMFPQAEIHIGTNGMLIRNMGEELIQAIKNTDACLVISMYPPTLKIIDDIVQFLKENNIPFKAAVEKNRITDFFRTYDLEGKNNIDDAYRNCIARDCTTVYKGKMSSCYFPVVAPFFNKKFGNFFYVSDDIIDLHNCDLTRDEVISKFRRPMSACRYCSPHKSELWTQVGKTTEIKDWVY